MANHSLHNKLNHQQPKETMKPFVYGGNNLGFCFSGTLNKDSTRVLGSNQDHKRRCLEKLLDEDVKCALEVEVVDDTALIEATAAVTRFKNRYRKETDPGFRNNGGLSDSKVENSGKKKRFKRRSMKCVNEKKLNDLVVEDETTEGKGHKGCRKTTGKSKYVYRKKSVVTGGHEEHHTVEDESVVEKAVDVSFKASVGDEKESTIKLVQTYVSFKVSVGDATETETESVNEKDNIRPEIDVVIHSEVEDETVNVGSKKSRYTRAEMEALRFVDEAGQTAKWNEVYSGFAPSVAREYVGLLFDVSDGPHRYKRVVNCGSARYANPILSMPPVLLPLCSHRKFDRIVNSN